MKKSNCNWEYDGLSGHNGEYWYKCKKCKAKDWIASYGTEDQLRGKCKPTQSSKPSPVVVECAKAVSQQLPVSTKCSLTNVLSGDKSKVY